MMKHRLITSFILCFTLLVGACSVNGFDSASGGFEDSPAAEEDLSKSNPTGGDRPSSLNLSASRIVTLTSLTADLVHHLDASKLVGIPGSQLITEDPRFADIEAVTGGRTPPNLEKIVALEPDLVIGASGFHDDAAESLKNLGIPVFLTEVNSWHALNDLTETLADIVDANPDPLLQRYQQCLAQAPDQTSNQAPGALALVSRQPLLSPNRNSWAGDFLAQFNLRNLTAELQEEGPAGLGQSFRGYVTLSPEKVLEANPEVLLIVDVEGDVLDYLSATPFWNQLKAVETGDVYVMDYHGLVNPGSLDSIDAACHTLAEALLS